MIILRLVLQNISQPKAFVHELLNYLKPTGQLLIIEARDANHKWTPGVATFDEIIQILTAEQAEKAGGRTIADTLHRKASIYGYKPERNEFGFLFGETSTEKRQCFNYGLLLAEIVGRLLGRERLGIAMYKDLKSWIDKPEAKMQMGLHFLQMRRKDKS